jgi:pimeloyl-ACP methyl ester carboxylesterase
MKCPQIKRCPLTKRGEAVVALTLVLFGVPLCAAEPGAAVAVPVNTVVADTSSAAGRADPLTLRIRQGFADSIYGQVHYLKAQPESSQPRRNWKTPLVMFHQSPLSAREFGPLIAEMGRDRVVIAFDSPGQGLSDGPDRPVKMAQFAVVMDQALTAMGYGARHPIDVFGNHTGVWVGSELAIRDPKLVRKLVFNGIYVVPESVWRANIARLTLQNSSGDFFDTMATYLPASRKRYLANGMSESDWGRMVVDTLGPLQRREFGHVSAFSYAEEAEARLKLITQPVTVLLIDDGIADKSRSALPLFQRLAKVIDRTQWKEGLFYTHTAEVAAVLRAAFD